jgi:hypothetical protein
MFAARKLAPQGQLGITKIARFNEFALRAQYYHETSSRLGRSVGGQKAPNCPGMVHGAPVLSLTVRMLSIAFGVVLRRQVTQMSYISYTSRMVAISYTKSLDSSSGYTTEDENPLSRHPVVFRPYILPGAYWYESGRI